MDASAPLFFRSAKMKTSALMMVVLLGFGCGDDEKKSNTNPNNVTNNSTNNGTNTIDISDYDQSCEFDSNCVLVNLEPCGCSCASKAINTSDEAAYNTAVQAITCEEPGPLCDPFCEERLPACAESECYARTPQIITADDFDKSCESAEDCMFIATGEICSACQCATEPVNRVDYEAKRPGLSWCRPDSSLCSCPNILPIACNNSICGVSE